LITLLLVTSVPKAQADIVDADNDGLPIWEEIWWGTDLAKADTDDDGLLDGEEVYTYKTDPTRPDSETVGEGVRLVGLG